MRRAAMLFGFLAWLGCVPRRAPDEATPPPMATLSGIRLEYFRGKDLAAVGRAAEMTYERTTGDLAGSQVFVHIWSRPESGALRPAVGGMELSAPAMTGNLLRKQAEGSQGVVIQTGAGIVAHTARARVDGMRASGKEQVRVDGPGYVLTADSFDASLEDGDFEFAGRVTTRFERQR